MPSTPARTQDLQKMVRLCLVFSSNRMHLRLLDAVLRADADQVREHLAADISSSRAADSHIYPMILQLVIDHGHPAILEEFVKSGNTADTLDHSPPAPRMRNGSKTIDAGDMCAWRLSTDRCIQLVEQGMLKLTPDTFERFLMHSDPAGFDRLLDIVFHPHTQPELIASTVRPVSSAPWKSALVETPAFSVVGAWMADCHLPTWCVDLVPSMHPLIQAQAREMARRWTACIDALIEKSYPAPDPAARLQAFLSAPERIRVDLGLSDGPRLLAGILDRAMEQASAHPDTLPASAMPSDRLVDKYNWMHALLLCGFKSHHFPRDPLSELLSDAGSTIKTQGNRARFGEMFTDLYARIASDLISAGSNRLGILPHPFRVDASTGMPAFVGHAINGPIASLAREQSVALGDALIMHATTAPARAPSSPSRRM